MLTPLDPAAIAPTREALHDYARVLGAWLKTCRPRRKHWWHASLRPSLAGLTTGLVHAGGFELELDLAGSALSGRSVAGDQLEIPLRGQPAAELASDIEGFLRQIGCVENLIPRTSHASRQHSGYRSEVARELGSVTRFVAAALEEFRAAIREETSPIQLWPHHFDVAMLWLSGATVAGVEPADAESADEQMNFGFGFGDAGIAEPYFYVTAYPLPDALPERPLPAGVTWETDAFDGALLRYRTLCEMPDPRAYLLELWRGLLTSGRELLAARGQ